MNFTDLLRRAIELARQALIEADRATISQLRGEVRHLSLEIESLFQNWPTAPIEVEDWAEPIDQAFFQAGESYLDVCDRVDEALEVERPELIEEAEAMLSEASRAMIAAEELVAQKFNAGGLEPQVG